MNGQAPNERINQNLFGDLGSLTPPAPKNTDGMGSRGGEENQQQQHQQEPPRTQGAPMVPRRAADDLGDDETSHQTQPANNGQQQQNNQNQQQQPPPFSADALAEALRKQGIGVPPPQNQPQQQRPPTQEELKKLYNVFELRPDHIQAILNGGDGAMAAMTEVLQGTALQNLTMSQEWAKRYIQEQMAPIMQGMAPLQQHYVKQQEEQARNQFYEKNPDLKPFDALLTMHVEDARRKKMDFPGGVPQAIDYFASAVRETLKQANIQVNGGQQQNTQQQQQTSRSKMAPVPMGGQPGPNNGGQARPVSGNERLNKNLFGRT